MDYKRKKILANELLCEYLDRAYESIGRIDTIYTYALNSSEREELREVVEKKITSIKNRYKLERR